MRPRAFAMCFEEFFMHLSWYMMSFGHLCRFWTLLHTSLMFANIWRRLEYVRYSGIVRTMPTCTIWHLDIWSGSLFSDLYDFDFVLTFGYCGERTTFALLLHFTEFWLRSRAEHSALHIGLKLWDVVFVWRTDLEMEHEVSMVFCIATEFCKGIWVNHFVLE